MTGELVFAFVAGTVATANPCGFALLPAFVARQLASDEGSRRRGDVVGRALVVGGLTTLGFLLVFGTIGTALTLGAIWLSELIPWAALAIGAALILAGLALLMGRRIGLRIPVRLPSAAGSGYRSVLLFGLAYGLTSLSCTLPIFLVVVGAATTGTSAGAPLMFIAYALGMGTILTALAVAAGFSRAAVAARIRRLLPYVDRVGAVLLIGAGAYVVYYWSFGLFAPESTSSATKSIDIGSRLSSDLQTWLGGETGKTISTLLAAAVVGLAAWTVWCRIRLGPVAGEPRTDGKPAVPEDLAGEPAAGVSQATQGEPPSSLTRGRG